MERGDTDSDSDSDPFPATRISIKRKLGDKQQWGSSTKMIVGCGFLLLIVFLIFRGSSGTEETMNVSGPEDDDDMVQMPRMVKKLKGYTPGDPTRKDFLYKSHFGEVEITEFVPSMVDDFKTMIVLHGMNSAKEIREEWYRVAEKLSHQGYTVFCPNLHSNPFLAPKHAPTDDQIDKFIIELIQDEALSSIIIGGKSWGGGKAANFAHRHPRIVTRAVLVAPGSVDPSEAISIPTLLVYCEDDRIGRKAKRSLEECVDDEQLQIFTVPSGGHRIVEEMDSEIIKFVTTE